VVLLLTNSTTAQEINRHRFDQPTDRSVQPHPLPKPQLKYPSPLPLKQKTLPPPPEIISFSIPRPIRNARVVLKATIKNRVTHYRAVECGPALGGRRARQQMRNRIYNAPWKPYRPNPVFVIEDCLNANCTGEIKICFQVKNEGGVSRVAEARSTLRIRSHPETRRYTVSMRSVYEYSISQGFRFVVTPQDSTSRCHLWPSNPHIATVAEAGTVFGSKCDFTLFEGRQLNEGWRLVSYTIEDYCSGSKRGYRIIEKPVAGSRNIRFKFHQWIEARGLTGENFYCTLKIKDFVLEGPYSRNPFKWRDAFRR
jgi:hypothetical protein